MNLNMIKPKNETEDLLLSITKNCETVIEQTHRKPRETLKFKIIKQRATFQINPHIHIKGDWMIRITDLEVYNSIFNINHTNNKFELYTDTIDDFSFEEIKDELEEILDIPNITDAHLQDEILGPRIFSTYNKIETELRMTDG